MSLDMWQGAEQEFTAGSQPIALFEALGRAGVFVFRSPEGIPRAYLRNGGLCYIHSNLFEVSTPECRNALELLVYDKASEAYARLASWSYEKETNIQIHCYKTSIALRNEDEAAYTTLGAHENYLVERSKYLEKASLLVPYLVMRQIFCGVGGYYRDNYLVSPRAMFPKTIYSEKSSDWPIVSLRDEPHAEERYFRVHVVNGEGARSDYTTFLKHSITSYILTAIQDGHIRETPKLEDPIASGQEISQNLEGDWSVNLADGKRVKVTDYIDSYYLEGIEKVFEERESKEGDRLALTEFKWVLGKLGEGLIEDLDRSIDWVIKLSLIERGFKENFQLEKGLSEDSAKRAAAFQYTAVTDPLFDELAEKHGFKEVVSTKETEKAFMEPPENSRGKLRVALATRFRDSLKEMSWSHFELRNGKSFLSQPFQSLVGWTQDEISKTIREIEFKLSKDKR